MSLRAVCAHHHFASSVETTYFRCQPPEGKRIEELALTIKDHSGAEVYKAEWFSGTLPADGKYVWDGEDNVAAPKTDSIGKTVKQYVSPLGAPFTATFKGRLVPAARPKPKPTRVSSESDANKTSCPIKKSIAPPDDGKEYQEGSARVWVLYREVKFEPITWLDVYKVVSDLSDGSFPSAGTLAQQKMWLVYKLNELGYLAGSITSTPAPEPLLRALFRYTQSHPDLAKFVDYQTLDAGAPGSCTWGWRALWETKFGTPDQLCTGGFNTESDDLLNRLKNNERPRNDLIETPAALLDRQKQTRVILDHDIYYLNKDFLTANANADYDKEFLNPFCQPFRARILLLSQNDRQGNQPGVDAPKGIGNVDCSWVIYDPPDDLSLIPPPVSAQIPLKSRAPDYVDETHKKLAGQHGDKMNSLDNCPAALGGVRPDDPGDMSPYFSLIEYQHKFPGGPGVYFHGSYIAGDNYVVQVTLSIQGAANEVPLKKEHRCVAALKDAFDDPKRMDSGDPDRPLTAQSAMLTLWRRHQVLREVVWDSTTYPPIAWPTIVENYKAAHVIVTPPKQGQIKLDALLPAPTLKQLAQSMVADPKAAPATATKTEFDRRATSAAFSQGAMYPLPLLTLDQFETAFPAMKGPADDPVARFDKYSKSIIGQNAGWPAYDSFVGVARQLREALNEKKEGPGIVIMRVRHMPIPDFSTLLPAEVFRKTAAPRAAFAYSRGIATGMDYGIVFLDTVNASKYEESYFVSHEISHCLFGSHPFEVVSGPDHDTKDKNCLMYYNEAGDKGNSGVQFGWALKSVPEQYTMRILVEYDTTQADECGTLSEPWVKDIRTKIRNIEWRVFALHADVAQIRKSFSRLKFTPAKWLDENREVKICLESPLGSPPVSPKLSLAYPFMQRTSRSNGSIKPFAHINVEPVDNRAAEPRFCGKCVLKLRGWRVFPPGPPLPGGVAPAIIVPDSSRAVPINGRMAFRGYKIVAGEVTFNVVTRDQTVTFGFDTTDPGAPKQMFGPFIFNHLHQFSFQSSTGNLQDLQGMLTREVVRWRSPTQGSPFNAYADPDQHFAQVAGPASDGGGFDEHSMRLPALICRRSPTGVPAAGTIIGEQSYQYCAKPGYSRDPADWIDIPDSQFLLEKSVYQSGKHWVMCFKKSNHAPKNQVPFQFEVHYKIGSLPTFIPGLTANKFAGATTAAPVFGYMNDGVTVIQEVWAAGANTMHVKNKNVNSQETTLEELKKKGFVISGTPTP